MKKRILKIVGVIVGLLILAAIFLPIYDGATCTLSPEKTCNGGRVTLSEYIDYKKSWNLARSLETSTPPLQRFPELIGSYKLDNSNYYGRTDCSYIEEENVCINTTRVTYRKDSTHEVISVNFIRAIKGKDLLLSQKDAYFTEENLEGYKAGWSGSQYGYGPSFTWFPQKDIDIITVSEGIDEKPPEGDGTIYRDKTTGTSLVSLYFLNKYPPERVN